MNNLEENSDSDSSSSCDSELNVIYQEAILLLEDDEKKDEAFKKFEEVIVLEQPKGNFGFDSVFNMIQSEYNSCKFDDANTHYKRLSEYIENAVTFNYSEEKITSLLEKFSNLETDALIKFRESTVSILQKHVSPRLWIQAVVVFGKLCIQTSDWYNLQNIFYKFYEKCGSKLPDLKKSNESFYEKHAQLLKVFAIEIQMYTALNKYDSAEQVYNRANAPNMPEQVHDLGIFFECMGKLHILRGEFEQGQDMLFKALDRYNMKSDELKACVDYVCMNEMLMPSNDEPEWLAEFYEVAMPMKDLARAYKNNDLNEFDSILDKKQEIKSNSFIEGLIEYLRNTIRIVRYIQEYKEKKVLFASISGDLGIRKDEVYKIATRIWESKKIKGKVLDRGGGPYFEKEN